MNIGMIEKMLHLSSKIRTRLFTLLLTSQFKEIGASSRIVPPFRFYGLNQISVGENVMINRDCWIHTIPDNKHDVDGAKLIIGSHVSIGMGSHISAAKHVMIGDYVLIAPNVFIQDISHAFERTDVPIIRQGISRMAPVVIGRGTWLGHNVVVLPGVTIGQHCVVGANSVVNSSIPDFCVAVGAPARVVKRYVPETRQWVKVCQKKL